MEKYSEGKQLNKRYEKKYILNRVYLDDFLEFLETQDFVEDHAPNFVNNTYYDNNAMSALFENINGDFCRRKYRVRFYNNDKEKILETKIKLGNGGFKERRLISQDELEVFLRENQLRPVISNQYFRRYYVNSKSVRITVDSQLRFQRPGSILNVTYSNLIVEIKSSIDSTFDFSGVLPGYLQLSKFSKFVEGISAFSGT